jgi:hypothetical protein
MKKNRIFFLGFARSMGPNRAYPVLAGPMLKESRSRKNKKLGATQTKSEESGNFGDLDVRSLVERLTTHDS